MWTVSGQLHFQFLGSEQSSAPVACTGSVLGLETNHAYPSAGGAAAATFAKGCLHVLTLDFKCSWAETTVCFHQHRQAFSLFCLPIPFFKDSPHLKAVVCTLMKRPKLHFYVIYQIVLELCSGGFFFLLWIVTHLNGVTVFCLCLRHVGKILYK